MDLHSGQVQGFFSKPVDHMTAMPMLTQYFLDQAFDDDLVIVSPDAGRVKVARNFARKVGVHWAVMEKERPSSRSPRSATWSATCAARPPSSSTT